MKKSSTLSSSAGFSLVELMVVVAIIGILAAMSVGQVQKQIAKARQSEAKTNLASLFTAEQAFRSEFNSFTTDFGAIKLAYNGALRYHVGFGANHQVSTGLGYTGTSSATAFNTNQSTAVTCPGCTFLPGAVVPTAATTACAAGTFTARARGTPMAGVDDQWQINESKALTNPVDGIQ